VGAKYESSAAASRAKIPQSLLFSTLSAMVAHIHLNSSYLCPAPALSWDHPAGQTAEIQPTQCALAALRLGPDRNGFIQRADALYLPAWTVLFNLRNRNRAINGLHSGL
jgi:hypothetical protein